MHLELFIKGEHYLKINFEFYSKAEEGYKFCMRNLERKVEDVGDEVEVGDDALLLWAMSLDWYARFLLARQRMDEALLNFKKAYDMSLKIHGEVLDHYLM